MLNVLSVDVEDYFHVEAFADCIPKTQWALCRSRVERNVDRILVMLERHDVKATFFVLGWVAERVPDLIRKVESHGHEIAVHGYNHLLLTEITPQEFEADLVKALETIEKCGVKSRPIGFRAPSFTIVEKTKPWALPILEKYQFKYDSSVFPIRFHPDYGVPDAPLVPYKITESLYEFPMSCLEMFGRRFPFGGGGYFRLFPYAYTKFCLRKVNNGGRPTVFYLHPWELDPGQPRVANLSLSQKIRHYRNLDKTENRFAKLLKDFEFTTMREVLGV